MTLHLSPLHGGFETLPDGSVRWFRRTPIFSSLDDSVPTPTTESASGLDVGKDSSGPRVDAGESNPLSPGFWFSISTFLNELWRTGGIVVWGKRDAD